MTKLRITQIKSRSGLDKRQIANLRSLGLRRIRHTVEVEKNPTTEGMIRKVQHVIVVEEIN